MVNPSTLSSTACRAVSNIIGMSLVRLSVFTQRHSSFPSISGIITSLTITSGISSDIFCQASRPLEADCIRKYKLRLSFMKATKSSLSSTIRANGFSFSSSLSSSISSGKSSGSGSSSISGKSSSCSSTSSASGAGLEGLTCTCLTGSSIRNTLPDPTLSTTRTVPSCSVTKSRTRLKPIPLPVDWCSGSSCST